MAKTTRKTFKLKIDTKNDEVQTAFTAKSLSSM